MIDLGRFHDITLELLVSVLDLRDLADETGHSSRVTAYTIGIAREMGFSAETIRGIARGAFLHDIGTISVPDSILRNPGRLSAEEMKIMRTHSLRGYQLLRRVPFLTDAAEIVYAHHEWWDGTGYPRGLRGQEIPVGARIFSIADTIEAVTSERPYRAARSFAYAREEILRGSGKQYDPEVVNSFLKMPDAIWMELREAIKNTAIPAPSIDGGPSAVQ